LFFKKFIKNKIMVGKLITLLVVALIGWLAYTQLLGTTEEKNMGKELIDSGKGAAKSIGNILKHEQQKFKSGTYDGFINKVGDIVNRLREQQDGAEYNGELDEIMTEQKRLSKLVEKGKETHESLSPEDKKAMESLANKLEDISSKLEK
jgi:hypothetical protein